MGIHRRNLLASVGGGALAAKLGGDGRYPGCDEGACSRTRHHASLAPRQRFCPGFRRLPAQGAASEAEKTLGLKVNLETINGAVRRVGRGQPAAR